MAIVIGSARHDENGKLVRGAAGDQRQKSSTNDTVGEVSMQNFYVHSKGWYILRPKTVALANAIAAKMKIACNNANIGYDQNQRLGVITNGIASKVKTETDCSTLIRACVKEASGKDPGNMTTADECTKLEATGLFEKRVKYISQTKTPIYNGDVLCTCTKGHTVAVVSGSPRPTATSTQPTISTGNYYPKYTGSSSSITTALSAVGEKDTSLTNRKKIGAANNISGEPGSTSYNTQMLNLLKAGKLLKATSSTSTSTSVSYYPKYTGSTGSITTALTAVGEPDVSLTHRKKIATANGVSGYTGSISQNNKLLTLLKSGKLIKA